MRAIAQITLLILVAEVAFAQHRGGGFRGGGGFRAFGFGSGVVRQPRGNIVFPGTPIVPPSPLSVGPQASFADRLGATVGGFPAFTGAPFFPRHRGFGHSRAFITPQPFIYAPIPYPVPYSEPSSPAVVVVAPPQQPAPPVVINQTFNAIPARPADTVSYYDSPTRPAMAGQDDEVRTYLIAFKDHSIYSSLAYWVEGDTLHYVTPHGRRNQASLNLIDRELTDRLNQNREPAAIQLSATGKNRK